MEHNLHQKSCQWWRCSSPGEIKEITDALAPPRVSAGAVPEKLLVAAPTSCKSNNLLEQCKTQGSQLCPERLFPFLQEGHQCPLFADKGKHKNLGSSQRLQSLPLAKQHQKNCWCQCPLPAKAVTCLSKGNTGKCRHLSSVQRICRSLCQQYNTRKAAGSSSHFHERVAAASSLIELWGAQPVKSTRYRTPASGPGKSHVSGTFYTPRG